MIYFDFLELNKNEITEKLEILLQKYKVQPVGNGYIDCIIMKENLEEFVEELTTLGIVISDVTWWCYVNPDDIDTGCPHGMGGPRSKHYKGWFSELQNKMYEVEEEIINTILESYNKGLIKLTNISTIDGINNLLREPFRYTPKEYIKGNKCVMPALWLLVPDDWRRQF